MVARREAVSLGVVGAPRHDRIDDHVEELGVHLSVTVHDGDDVEPVLDGPTVAGLDGRADTLVPLVSDRDGALVEHATVGLDGDGRTGRPLLGGLGCSCRHRVPSVDHADRSEHRGPRVVGRPVVDGVDAVDELGHRLDDVAHERFLVVSRNHYTHQLVVVHDVALMSLRRVGGRPRRSLASPGKPNGNGHTTEHGVPYRYLEGDVLRDLLFTTCGR